MPNQLAEAVRILEGHCILPRDDVDRAEVFAAFAVLRRAANEVDPA